jgi:hypothetical protein
VWRKCCSAGTGADRKSVSLRVAVVKVWSAANAFRLTAANQQQRGKDVLSVRTYEEMIDCSARCSQRRCKTKGSFEV